MKPSRRTAPSLETESPVSSLVACALALLITLVLLITAARL